MVTNAALVEAVNVAESLLEHEVVAITNLLTEARGRLDSLAELLPTSKYTHKFENASAFVDEALRYL